jgi:hypothetical protein
MHTFRALNIDTVGELADALKGFAQATPLKLFLGEEEAQGAWGGIDETGAYELHIDDEKDERRAARLERERKAVREAAGDPRDLEPEVSPSQRKAHERNKQIRADNAARMGTGATDKFGELGIAEAPAGQPTGAEDQNVREGQFDRNKLADPRHPAEVVTHRRAVERAAAEPDFSAGGEGKRVPLQKAESQARNPASLAHGQAPLPETGPMSAGSLAAHEADVREQDAIAQDTAPGSEDKDETDRQEKQHRQPPPPPQNETPAQRAERERREQQQRREQQTGAKTK